MTPASNHPIHPWYGPCDALADGVCAECLKEFERLSIAAQSWQSDFIQENQRLSKAQEEIERLKAKARQEFTWPQNNPATTKIIDP